MTALLKGLIIILFFSAVIVLFSLLPSTDQYPLDPTFRVALLYMMGYTFAWGTMFPAIFALFSIAILMIAIEVIDWIWSTVRFVIGIGVRLFG